MDSASLLELEISALSHDGRGLAFLPGEDGSRGKALFIPAALPGQRVLCRPGADHGSWQEAALVQVLDAGANNAPPLCPQARACGGCPLQAMPYGKQLLWKERILLDAMRRIGGYKEEELQAVWQGVQDSPDLLAFRNKIELAIATDEQGRPYPGMRRRSSHEVVPITSCALVDEEANEILAAFTGLLHNWEWPKNFWRFLVMRKDRDEDGQVRWRINAITAPSSKSRYAQVRDLASALLKAQKPLFAFIHDIRRHPSKIAKGEKRIFSMGQDGSDDKSLAALSLPLGGRIFNTDASSFFQVNDKASEKLARLVRQADTLCQPKNTLLDLYCGAGAPGLLLAPAYRRYLGLELDAEAIGMARRNAQDLAHCSFQAGDAAKLLERLSPDFSQSVSTILADPPRAGVDRRAMNTILKIAPANIIMVSCNPATLARDASLLAKDYTLRSLAGADLFPHSPHVEACALWTRK